MLREAREVIKDTLRAGLDPAHEKRRTKLEIGLGRANLFEAIAREWHENKNGAWTGQECGTRYHSAFGDQCNPGRYVWYGT
jgi:hypothetical protein